MRRKRPPTRPRNKGFSDCGCQPPVHSEPRNHPSAPAFGWAQTGDSAVDAKCGSTYTLTIAPTSNVYLDAPYLSIRWDSVHQHVHTEWKAFANSAELRAALLKGVQAIRENHAAAYVSDARKIRVIVHDDQKWINSTWKPLAIDAGLKRIAFVTAASGLGKLTVEDVSVLVNDDRLQSRTFSSMAAARQWVSEVRVPR